MKLLNVTNTAVELGDSPFFVTQDCLLTGVAGLILQGSQDGSTGWTAIGSPTAVGVFQEISLDYKFLRCSTAATVQLINN